MTVITLPDGKNLEFDHFVTAHEVAETISKKLAKRAVAAKLNDKIVDLSTLIKQDSKVTILTSEDPEGLEVLRHSTAHLLAHAVQSVYPQAQVTIGPVIEDGFYYDFAFDRPFTPEDLALFEAKMQELSRQNLTVTRHEFTREEAIDKFTLMGEKYKVKIIEKIPAGEVLSFYQQGDFIDLCRGPHVPSTGRIQVFKLMKVAGAYWEGNSENEMLQRIYGTCWADQKELKQYLFRLEEAEKRDHRKLGKKYDLFHMQEEAPGMVFWHPKGWVVYQQIVQYIRKLITKNDYQEVNTPQLVDRSLWERSGHWAMFGENMFTVTCEEKVFAIKPMNCPCHVQIFNQGIKSYRELPIRLAEFGSCHRNEPSGALHGIMRARNFVQDDAHIFCTEDQIQDEVSCFIDLLFKVYKDFGFEEVLIKLSTRPDQRVGSDEVWDKAELALQTALDSKALKWELHPKEGAFYGPKIEFSLKDCLGRVWQCGTIQVDFSMPDRLGAQYVAEDSSKKVPVILHRAILGSLERFIGILIEQYAGSLPVWLSPVQVAVLNITESQAEYVTNIANQLSNLGIRAVADLRNEKIGFKIREHTVQRVPYLLVVGDRERETNSVSVRTREGVDLGVKPIKEFEVLITNDLQLSK
ncbi:threonine--tRNA ligase [Candidatus Berkiella cookevillensis]|uniref:Threonine--tRNA ligase n=1 Tax=Candidatus Berkiella cookevillensis TaxID=437022 RepID=A0A0Q9YJ88_9GAMM|nr:threonine--tRNA ligase [Candidatus Berkiella cookevillensis]MCS5707972.1 threonine--tRNA ligase [Candidatus Berkiella cookevillensis]